MKWYFSNVMDKAGLGTFIPEKSPALDFYSRKKASQELKRSGNADSLSTLIGAM